MTSPPHNPNVVRSSHFVTKALNSMSHATFQSRLPSLPGDVKSHADFMGFNGEWIRTSLILDVVRVVHFDSFVETGTYHGWTSLLMSLQTGLPVYTCDLAMRSYLFATVLLCAFRSVHVSRGDSRQFLRNVLSKALIRKPLVYLDAHWYSDLPLRDELRLIREYTPDAFVVIDDFRVPGDDGFGYDSYDVGTLEMDYLRPIVVGYTAFLPAYASMLESGRRRGWTMLVPQADAPRISERYCPAYLRAIE